MSQTNSEKSLPVGKIDFVSGEIDGARSDVARAQEHLAALQADRAKMDKLQKIINQHQAKLNASMLENDKKLANAMHVVSVRRRTLFQMENGANA